MTTNIYILHISLCIVLSGSFCASRAQTHDLDSLFNLYKSTSKKDIKLRENITRDLEVYTVTKPLETVKVVEQFLKETEKNGDIDIKIELTRLKANLAITQGKFDEGMALANKTIEAAGKRNLLLTLSKAYTAQGLAYYYQSKLPQAVESYNKGLKIAEQIGDQEHMHLVQNNLAGILIVQKDYTKAKYYLEKNLEYYKNFPSHTLLIVTLNNLGLIHEREKNTTKALEMFQKSANLKVTARVPHAAAQAYNNIGHCFSLLHQPDSAYYYFNKALETNASINNIRGMAVNKSNIANILFERKQYDKGKEYAQSAYQAGIDTKSLDVQKESAEHLLKIYTALHQADSALYYQKIYTTLADSISNEDNTRTVTKMEMQYDFDKKEAEYKHQQQLSLLSLQTQTLQNELNKSLLEKSRQEQQIQQAVLENQQLLNRENERKLSLATKEKTITLAENESLHQQNELAQLRMKQLWLFGLLLLMGISLLIFLWWNRTRIKQLRISNSLKEKETQELTQKHKITESELKAIRSQMNPHFIFNVFNSIEAYIVAQDTDKASDLIRKFAKLSRMILENSTQHLAVASREWTINQLYTEIEHTRFDESFKYDFTIEDKLDLEEIMLPPMIIQPLIENAIHHGIRHTGQAAPYLSVKIKKHLNQIEISVQDNGKGLHHTGQNESVPTYKKKSFGLSSIKERIDILNQADYGSTGRFEIIDLSTRGQKGTLAILTLPLIYVNEVLI